MRQMISPSALAAVALALTACGGKVVVDGLTGEGGAGGQIGSTANSSTASSSTGGGSIQEMSCTKFCAAAGEKGCPSGGDCQERCLAMFVDECVPEIVSLLDCTPQWLGVGCHIGYPDVGGCNAVVLDAQKCLTEAAGFTCTGEQTAGGDGSCISKESCSNVGPAAMKCDAQGTCTCLVGEKVVGTCKNLFGGLEFCSPATSCCASLLPK